MKHYNAHSNSPLEIYRVVTRFQTKMAGTQMLKAHGTDKTIDPKLKPETGGKREGIPMPTPEEPKSVAQTSNDSPTSPI